MWQSSHCGDLRVIALFAVIVGLLLFHVVEDEIVFGMNWVGSAIPWLQPAEQLCADFVKELGGIDKTLRVATFGGVAAVIGWAYQAANIRFGVADTFAAEIATLCRVAAVNEFMPTYVDLCSEGKEIPGVVAPRDYLALFNSNAKDLEVLDGDVARFVTQFYVHMKALEDMLGKGVRADAQDHGLRLIYVAFLAFESARLALAVLMDDRLERQEYILTAMLSEVPAYLLLYRSHESLSPLRCARVMDRFNENKTLIGTIRERESGSKDTTRTERTVRTLSKQVLELWDKGQRRSPMLEHDRALREHAIKERAFHIWEQKGRPAGEDLHNWEAAERELGYERPRSWADALKDDGGSNVLAR
jgi:hypothetical protein